VGVGLRDVSKHIILDNILEYETIIMLLTFILSAVFAQSEQEQKSVERLSVRMAEALMGFYTKTPGSDGQGAISSNTKGDYTGIQWYESGILWGAMLEHERNFPSTFKNVTSTALSLASGKSGSFLGEFALLAETLLGKWNDDLGW
jgi:hypothetical protein